MQNMIFPADGWIWISWEMEMSRAVGRRKNEYTIQIHVNETNSHP